MPVLDRQAVAPAGPLPPSLQGLPPRSVPETAPTPLQQHYINLSRRRADLRGDRDHRARARGAARQPAGQAVRPDRRCRCSSSRPADATLRIWRSAWAWMPVDRGKGLFRSPGWPSALVGLVALIARRRSSWSSREAAAMTEDGEFERGPRRPLDRPRLRRRHARLAGRRPQLLLALRGAARVRRRRRRGPRPARVRHLRPHRLRQPAARGDDASRSPTTASSSCSGAASSPATARGRSPAGSSRSTRPSTRRAIRETLEETGLLVEPGEIIGLYTRLEAAVVTIAFEARIVGGTAAPTPEATRGRGRSRPTGDPVGRDRVQRRRSGRCATGSRSVIRSSRPRNDARDLLTGRPAASPGSAQVDEDVLGLGVEVERGHPELAADARHLVAAERRLGVDRAVRVDADDARPGAPSPPAAPCRCRGSRSSPTGRTASRWRGGAPPPRCRTG